MENPLVKEMTDVVTEAASDIKEDKAHVDPGLTKLVAKRRASASEHLFRIALEVFQSMQDENPSKKDSSGNGESMDGSVDEVASSAFVDTMKRRLGDVWDDRLQVVIEAFFELATRVYQE